MATDVEEMFPEDLPEEAGVEEKANSVHSLDKDQMVV